jgi:hypothetical protein
MSVVVRHLGREDLEAGLAAIRQAPRNEGVLELIVRRPQVGEREVIDEGHLDLVQGLVGDNWGTRGSSRTADGSSHPEMQLTVMNSRVIALLAQDKSQWPLAGDQLFVDMDLSVEHLPPGTRLAMGSSVIEVTSLPHTGCDKFVARFGLEAVKFVNSPLGRELQLRGLNARVVTAGRIRVGDRVKVIPRPAALDAVTA